MPANYLFFVSQNYSFEILRPLQQAIRERGDHCAWYFWGEAINRNNQHQDETVLSTIEEAIEYNPRAVFVPGNKVPSFLPGLKVQVFHGLEWKKKGHFKIRGFFDLYCTQGEITTSRFNALAKKHGYFRVIETGWSKLDPLFSAKPYPVPKDRPTILYAPTFSPSLTSAKLLFEEIQRLSIEKDWFWLMKFHPKMEKQWVEKYKSIENENVKVIESDSILTLLQAANVMVSDTSSVIGEFSLLSKPVVTFRNAHPSDDLLNIEQPDQLEGSIVRALSNDPALVEAIQKQSHALHPYNDGRSSVRILEAVDHCIDIGRKDLKRRPLNLFREFELRRSLKYWKRFSR